MKIKNHQQKWIKLVLFLPAVIYLPGIVGMIPFLGKQAQYSDLLITHYSYAAYIRTTLFSSGTIPLWSNLIYTGMPLAGNPLAGLWYLPGWIAMFFPLPEGISIGLALHSIFGSWGLYLLLKEQGNSIQASILGALAFGFLPKILHHYGAGHVSLLYAISWTPWLFLTSIKDQKGWKTGLVAAMTFLADPRWAVLISVFWFTFDIAHRHHYGIKAAYFYLKSGLVAILLAAPLIVPMIELLNKSTRSNLAPEDRLIFSLPPTRLINLFLPVNGGNLEWFTYIGGIVLILFILVFTNKNIRSSNRYWLLWLGISLTISLGSYLPAATIITNMPLINFLRVPARNLFLTGFCFIIIAAKGADYYIQGSFVNETERLIGFISCCFFIITGIGLTFIVNEIDIRLIWGVGFAALSSLIVILAAPDADKKHWVWLLTAILVIDYLGSGLLNIEFREKKKYLSESSIATFLDRDNERFRLYSPSFSFPQYSAVLKGFELADGVEPFQLKAYTSFMEKASGVTRKGYAVTIPAFSTGNPDLDNRNMVPNPDLLGLLNVKYIISTFEINSRDLKFLGKYSGNILYQNEKYLPRAWILKDGKLLEDEMSKDSIKSATRISITPHRIDIEAEGPGKLILSEINYPGWIARVDGKRAQITPEYQVIRGVQIPEGLHEIEFLYRPISVYLGLILAVVGWVFCIWQFYMEQK